MHIAIIAPSDALPMANDEVENLIAILGKHHRLTLYQSQVTEQKLLASLLEPVDWVWVCSHTSLDGIQLSDGFVWKTSAFARWVLNISANLVILNTCFSAQLVAEIQLYAPVNIIATIVPEGIDDTDAAINAVYLANQLNIEENDVETAVRIATGNGSVQYRYFKAINDPTRAMKNQTNEEILQALEALTQRIIKLENLTITLERIIRGDADLQVASIQTQLALLREMYEESITEIKLLKAMIEERSKRPTQERGTIVISPVQILLSAFAIVVLFLIAVTFIANMFR